MSTTPLRIITATTLATIALTGCTSSAAVNFDIRLIDTTPLIEYHIENGTKCTNHPDTLPEITIKDANGTIVATGTMDAIGKWSPDAKSCTIERQIKAVTPSSFYTVE